MISDCGPCVSSDLQNSYQSELYNNQSRQLRLTKLYCTCDYNAWNLITIFSCKPSSNTYTDTQFVTKGLVITQCFFFVSLTYCNFCLFTLSMRHYWKTNLPTNKVKLSAGIHESWRIGDDALVSISSNVSGIYG